jgi:hypothetical protein
MRNKLLFKAVPWILLGSLVAPSVSVYAQTLEEAGLTESTRGYAGAGNQNKSRTEKTVSVKLSFGGGGVDSSDWSSLAEFTSYIDNEGEEILNKEYQVSDIDSDGDIDMTDLLSIADSDKRGSIDFAYTTSDYGDFYTSVLGVDAGGSFTYWLDGTYCSYGDPDLYDGDDVVLVAFTGDYNSWGTTDESAYEGYKSSTTYSSLADVREASKDSSSTEDSFSTKYLTQVALNVQTGLTGETSLSDGSCYWQELRALRFAKGADKDIFSAGREAFTSYVSSKEEQYEAGTLTAVNAMRVASVTGDEKYLDVLAHGYNGVDAAIYDEKAGTYAVDYILMCLDLNDYATQEGMSVSLADYAESESVRDDLIYYILNNTSCWGGNWFTYDTGAQNAQALVPYAEVYPEVKEKLDSYLDEAYNYFMDESYTGSSFDASSAGEVVRFAAMYGEYDKAKDIYDKVESIGLENTKFKGNAMDVTRMAIAEWGLNNADKSSSSDSVVPSVETVSGDYFIAIKSISGTSEMNGVLTIKPLDNITDAKLLELELELPEGLEVMSVTSEASSSVEYAVVNNKLRVTVGTLDGATTNFVTGDAALKFTVKGAVGTEYVAHLNSIKLWKSSEEYVEDAELERDYSFKLSTTTPEEDLKITATELYSGDAASEIVPTDMKAIKITVSRDIEGTLVYTSPSTNATYICYKSADMSVDGAVAYIALVPKTDTETLVESDNYSISTDEADQQLDLIFGDVNNDTEVTSADALQVVRMWVGKITPEITSRLVLSTNVSGDNTVDNADTLSIVEHITDNKDWKVIK